MAMVMATAMVTETIKTASLFEMTHLDERMQTLKRLAIVVITPLLLWQTVLTTAANVLREKTPEMALNLAPTDAGALAKRNDFSLVRDKASGQWRVSTSDAMKSLRSEGLNPRAVRQLAFVFENDGNEAKAFALMALSERMSRRDIGTQLWMAQHRAYQNDVKGALRHIDIGLRTTPESRAMLFPLLMTALTDQNFQTAFASYVSESPSWIASFIDYALSQRQNLDILSRSIIAAGGLPSGVENDKLNMHVLNHLASGGYYGEIRPYYSTLKKADLSVLNDIALSPSGIDPQNGPLSWSTVQDVDVDAAIVRADNSKKYQIDVTVDPGKRRLAAQKLLYLAPGQYRQSATHIFTAGGADAAINWNWSCAVGSKAIPLVTKIFRAAEVKSNAGPAVATVDIPEGCPIQLLTLTAVGGSDVDDSRITITELQIRKLKP